MSIPAVIVCKFTAKSADPRVQLSSWLGARPLTLSFSKDAPHPTPARSREGSGRTLAAYPVIFCNRGSVRLGSRSASKVLMSMPSMV